MAAPAVPDLGTLTVLLGAIYALTELIKFLVKALVAKLKEAPVVPRAVAPDITEELVTVDPVLEEIAANVAEVLRHQRDLDPIVEKVAHRVSTLLRESADMYRWHDVDVEPGVKIWWVRRSLEQLLKDLVAGQAEITDAVASVGSAVGKAIGKLDDTAKDVDSVKEDVTKVVIYLSHKYRTGKKAIDET